MHLVPKLNWQRFLKTIKFFLLGGKGEKIIYAKKPNHGVKGRDNLVFNYECTIVSLAPSSPLMNTDKSTVVALIRPII